MKMTVCDWVGENMVQFHEGELDAVALDRYWHHLGSCPDCRAEHARFSQMLGAVKMLASQQVQCDVRDAVMQRIAADEENRIAAFATRLNSALAVRSPSFVFASLVVLLAGLVQWSPVPEIQERFAAARGRSIDVVDEASGITLDLEAAASLARSNNKAVRVRPVVAASDSHRRALLEKALFQRVKSELVALGDAADFVEIGDPIVRPGIVTSMSATPYVLAVDSLH